jgi:hypothetical protein
MGLDAGVFKSVSRLRREYSKEFEIADSETGEAETVDGGPPTALRQLLAGDVRLGNIDLVGSLREIVEATLGEDSFIAKHVVYSGSHAGDCIPTDRLHLLREDLSRLKKVDDSDVARFIDAMEGLIDVAEKEGNPIVFL